MKTVLKLIGGLLIGGLIGLAIGGLIVVLFTDTTFSEYFQKYYTLDISEGLCVFLVAIGAFILSLAILIPVHELGHLVCGILSGYKFVSYRIFNYTVLKENGKFRIKKFSVPGTGGQCLLTPPELPLEEIPTGLYNFGGVLANILILMIVIPFFMLDLNPFVIEALGIFVITDVGMIILNGIPMKVGGLGNDGYNMKLLKRNYLSKKGILNQLRANALIQNGTRPKDMPDNLFSNTQGVDYRNPLEVSIPLMYASRLIDRMEYDEALTEMEALYSKRDEIMQLYVKEIACELAFLYMRTGRIEKADKILDNNLRKYIETYRKVMSSKERLLIAIAFYIDKNETEARRLYGRLKERKDEYLLKGEIAGDLALIEDMLLNDNTILK